MSEQSGSDSSHSKRKIVPIIEALLATLIWSSTFVIVKIGLKTLGPLTIAGLRYFLGAVVLMPFLYNRGSFRFSFSKDLWLKLALIGISSYTVGNGALFWGLKFLPATTGSFLLSLLPLLVLVGGTIVLKEIPTRWQILGVILTLIGSGLFFSSGLKPGEPQGILIVSFGLIGFLAFSLLGRGIAREKKIDTLTLTTIPLAIGGLLSMLIALVVEGIPHFDGTSIIVVAWLAVINTALGYLIYNHSLQDLTALEMNMIMNLTPLFTGAISWIVLGEELVFIQIIGMLVMIGGVIMVQKFNVSTSESE